MAFMDYDNDGWKDLFFVERPRLSAVDKYDWGTTFAERPLLFRNLTASDLSCMPAVDGHGTGRGAAQGAGRRSAICSMTARLDVVINNMDTPPRLLRNVNPDHHHWVELKLVGGAKGPRDAVGATVYLTSGGMRQRGDVYSGGSLCILKRQRVHFGLGDATQDRRRRDPLAGRHHGEGAVAWGGPDLHRRGRQRRDGSRSDCQGEVASV